MSSVLSDDSSAGGSRNFDVVIIGSGLTGLTAAYNILKRRIGLSTLVIEKNDAAGGRILREKSSQAFFGSYSQGKIATLMNQLEIPMIEPSHDDRRNFMFLTKDAGPFKKISPLVSGQVYHFLKLINSISTNHEVADKEQLGKMSVYQLMETRVQSSRARALCGSLLRACCPGIDNFNNVSALWFLVMLNGAGGLFGKLSATLAVEKRFFVEGGFRRVVERLEKIIIEQGGVIRRSEVVVRIETSEGIAVWVTTDSNKFKCECVVIAVPPPANARIIVETPALPEHLLESQNLYEGENKNIFFYAKYKEAFWPAGSVLVDTGEGPNLIYEATHNERNIRVIAGFSSGGNSLNDIFIGLNRCFRTVKASDCTSSGMTDASPINFMRPSPIEYHVNPMLLSLDKIYFAASEFATCWPGTADGAVEAGERAARSVISRIRPQALDATIRISRSEGTTRSDESTNRGVARAHAICLGLNVCLFFLLLGDACNT